jgi:amino acid transporter
MSSIDHPAVPEEGTVRPSQNQLRGAAMSLPSVVMQCVGQIGPAIGVLLTVPYIVGLTGTPGAFAFLLGFILMLTAAVPLAYLARQLPSAGGYYTYLSRTLHPRIGFLASWAWALYSPAAGAFSFSVLGYLLNNILEANYGINYPWWVTVVAGAAIIAVIGWSDVRVSGRALIMLSGLEMLIMLALSLWGLARPGPGGFSVVAFNPARSFSTKGLYLGVVFSIFALTGWEGAAPTAEESKNPRRAVPLALIGSTVLAGLFFVVVTWGLTVGWGTSKVGTFGTSAVTPAIVLAQRYWSGAWVFVLVATINSVFAVALASSNVSTRMWFAMARSGSLPRQLAHVHPRHGSPSNAVLLQAALTLAIGLGIGFWIGPANEFFLFGLALTVVMVIVYALGNAGVFRYFWLSRRPDRKLFPHVVLPLVSTVLLVYIGYKSLVPLPAKPVGWAPVVAAAWAMIGVALLVVMRMRGRERWLLSAGRAMNDPADEAAGPPA